jgi:hypothetical protein
MNASFQCCNACYEYEELNFDIDIHNKSISIACIESHLVIVMVIG